MTFVSKINYFVLLLVDAGLLYARSESVFGQNPTAVDLLLLSVGLGALAAPLVQELGIGGLTFKRALEETKTEVAQKLSEFRAEMANIVAVAPTFNVSSGPVSDSALGKLEASLKDAVDGAFKRLATPTHATETPDLTVEQTTQYLIYTRYHIERELRRIWGNTAGDRESRWPVTAHFMVGRLVKEGILPDDFERAIKTIYNVCSPAVHGETVSPGQVGVVRELAPKIISTLRSIL